MSRILVAFASVSGSTGEVAEAIADVLENDEILVEVKSVGEVADVAEYDAVVLGSSIRVGRWLPEAWRFLETHQEILSRVPVAYFTTCLTMVDDTEDSRRIVLAYMEPVLQQAPEVKPVGLGLFAGSLDPGRALIAQPPLMPQGDYRNWAAIRAWAREIRPALLAEIPHTPSEAASSDLREAVLCYTDMSGSDLSQVDLYGANLRESNLSEADLQKANLGKADLAGADLRKADLRQASLNWVEMDWANMSKADLRGANLIGAQLDRANLRGANLSRVILNGAVLSRANLRGADLSCADMNWIDLRGADLSQADLSEANLGWANLSGANLDQATLTNARYNAQTQWPEDFSAEEEGAILVGGMR